ncbi:MAG TPA: trigger factor [Solirubrobacterales bacterium]|nr:trigger factor [Solirubrobacterales bacterium]
MRTEITELPESRVKLDVAVEADAVSDRLQRTARELGRELRLPGFRKGKVPPALVIQRMGREAVLEQALREALPEWYERAVLDAGVAPIGEPQLDVPAMPGDGEELSFSVELGVRPKAKLGEYRGLEVGRPEIEVPDEDVQAELDRLREGFASLNPVDRPGAAGDVLVVDYDGTIDGEPFDGSSARDFMLELGAEGLLAEFDVALTGASAGDEVTVEVTFPDDHQPADLAGKRAEFAVTVKEVREKQLPDLDDDFAAEASEFETLDELRDQIATRLAEVREARSEGDFRQAAIDAAAAEATIDVPKQLIHARAHEIWDRIERSLAERGIDPGAYVQMQGKDRHELIDDAEPDAERALRREATLAAIADAEEIEVSDEELIEAIRDGDSSDRVRKPEKLLARLRETGRDALLRDEIRLRKAADVVVESAKPIPAAQAAARDALWTPEKGEREHTEGEGADAPGGERAKPGELWTPGT